MFLAIIFIFSCGCTMTDEAPGVWDRQPLPAKEKLTIKTDGTFFISDSGGNEKQNGTWIKNKDIYELAFENGTIVCAEIYQGRAKLFMIINNATYIKT